MLHSLDEPLHGDLVLVEVAADLKHAFGAALFTTAAAYALETPTKASTETAAKATEDSVSRYVKIGLLHVFCLNLRRRLKNILQPFLLRFGEL